MKTYYVTATRTFTALEHVSFRVQARSKPDAQRRADRILEGYIPGDAHWETGDTLETSSWEVDPEDTRLD